MNLEVIRDEDENQKTEDREASVVSKAESAKNRSKHDERSHPNEARRKVLRRNKTARKSRRRNRGKK